MNGEATSNDFAVSVEWTYFLAGYWIEVAPAQSTEGESE